MGEVAVDREVRPLTEQVVEEEPHVVGFSAILWHRPSAPRRQGLSHGYGLSKHPCVLH